MDRLKEMIKEKDFVINSLILKNIKKFNISINELLLLLYFINVNNELNTSLINKYTSLEESEILEAFDGLTSRGLIEIIMKKVNDRITEEISLDIFYNKILIDMPDVKKQTDIYAAFEGEFGRTLSPIEYETISKWLQSNVSEETIKSALKEAVLNGVTNLRYIDKIIYEWTKKKINTNTKDSEDVKVFDYNWLEDDNE